MRQDPIVRSLCSPSVELRTHHLHVVEHASSGWRDWLLFRDCLRDADQAARRYAALKTERAAQDRHDRVRYRSGKAPLISELMSERVHGDEPPEARDPGLPAQPVLADITKSRPVLHAQHPHVRRW